MPEALEWFQCKRCGRRQRWTAENAGRTITCSCSAQLLCPRGPGLSDSMAGRGSTGTFSDTLIEDSESSSAVSPFNSFENTLAYTQEIEYETARPLSMEEVRASKNFYTWFFIALFGLAMMIHMAYLTQYWPLYWWYSVLGVLVGPLSLWKFNRSRRRWQRGRPFWTTLTRSLGADA